MLVSLIIPVYNVEKYIERCFTSITSQSYKNYECIFVDDFSSDGSNRILRGLISAYNGPGAFKLLNHGRNQGLSVARNSGIDTASGDYVLFLDSDDALLPDCIENLVSLAMKYPGVDIVQGSAVTVNEKNQPAYNYTIDADMPEFSDNHLAIAFELLDKTKIPVTAWNKLIRTDYIRTHSLMFLPGIIHEDNHWCFLSAAVVSSMAFCKIPGYRHHIRTGSIMSSSGIQKSLISKLTIMNDCIGKIEKDLLMFQSRMLYKFILGIIKGLKSMGGTEEKKRITEELRELTRLFLQENHQDLGFRIRTLFRMTVCHGTCRIGLVWPVLRFFYSTAVLRYTTIAGVRIYQISRHEE